MASNSPSPRRHSRRQSIPLQDLSRPPDISINDGEEFGHRRSVSGRARALLGTRSSFHGRLNTSGTYERVAEGSPTRHERSHSALPHVTTPRNAHQSPYTYDDGELSPVNAGDFQAAMGSVGLSFEPAGSSRSSTAYSPNKRGSSLGVITESEAATMYPNPVRLVTSESEENYTSPADNDRTPLTDNRFLQPISGVPASMPSGQRHDRQGSRLGDDLPNAEAGLRPTSTYSSRSLSRSLSTSSPASHLTRAGTMMRKMSQRVVNLSNEPDPIEPPVRRQPENRQDVLEGPPSFPAMDAYAHDEPQRTPPQIEKTRPLVFATHAKDEWQQTTNPLRGKTLGIFSPDNWLRLWLCEVLVHPVTEPVILVLIVIQTILLATDSAPSLASNSPDKKWQSSWLHFPLLVLFILYTLEIGARCIVSGFIKNPDEYSTVSWNIGFRKVILDRTRSIFTPNKRQATLHSGRIADPQQSIIHSFTGLQAQVDQPGHSRQQQRVRLARRAFLRHSFNRLDFLAVVSFWISFTLEIMEVEQSRHVFVFRMLSCLRILRLLGLTSGTSVC